MAFAGVVPVRKRHSHSMPSFLQVVIVGLIDGPSDRTLSTLNRRCVYVFAYSGKWVNRDSVVG